MLSKIRGWFNKWPSLKFRDEDSLQSLIKQQRKRIFPKRRLTAPNIYYPSWSSFLIIGTLVLLLNILARLINVPAGLCFRFANFVDKLGYAQSNHFQNLIAIHAGIGTIIFALVIFIAESLRDDEEKDKARVLLRQSFLFPLAVGEILTFSIFLWGDINAWSIVPIILIGLLTILSLARLIIVLLNKNKYQKIRIALLGERLKGSINCAIDERLGNSILFSYLKGMSLEFNLFAKSESQNALTIKSDIYGKVTDVNLSLLRKVGNLIEYEANKNRFSFEKKAEADLGLAMEESPGHTQSRPYEQLRSRYIAKKYLDPVTPNNCLLLSYDRRLVTDEKKITKIDKLVKQAFTIRQADSFSDEVRNELSSVRDQFIGAIQKRQLGKLEELSDIYKRLAETFLETITTSLGGYSLAQAYKESHSLAGGWDEADWLKTDILEIFDCALMSHDWNIIRQVGYLPFAIAARAINFKDQYLFQQFIHFAERLYISGRKEEDQSLKKLLLERSWRWLKETSRYQIEPRLLESTSAIDINAYKDFAVYIFKVLLNILKRCYDEKDRVSFNDNKKVALDAFMRFKPSQSRQNAEQLQWQLDKFPNDKAREGDLQSTLELQKKLENAEKEISNSKYQMLFGLASWILSDFIENKNEAAAAFFSDIQAVFAEDLETFTSIFLDIHDFDNVDYWGLELWDFVEEGVIYTGRALERLEVFYVVKALLILSSKLDADIGKIKLPHNRDFAFLAEGSRELLSTLEDISRNKEKWAAVLPERAIDKIDALSGLIAGAKMAEEQDEKERKRREALSSIRIRDFKKALISAFYEGAEGRKIFRHLGLYKDELGTPVAEVGNRLEINTVDDKGFFLDNWPMDPADWGGQYGREIAKGENGHIIRELSRYCAEQSSDHLREILNGIKNAEDKIIFISNASVHDIAELEENYRPHWKCGNDSINLPGFMGYFLHQTGQIPIFFLYSDIARLLILEKKCVGDLVQKNPLNKGEEIGNIEDIFFIKISAYSDDPKLAEKLISTRVDWLSKVGTEEDQRQHLLDRVLIQICERFEIRRGKDCGLAGTVFKLKDED